MQISTKNGKSKHLFYIYKKNNGEKNQIKKLGKNCKQLQKKNSYKKKKKKRKEKIIKKGKIKKEKGNKKPIVKKEIFKKLP